MAATTPSTIDVNALQTPQAVTATAAQVQPAAQANLTTATLDQQNGLVQNQISKIIDQNSPLMQRAAARAREQMAARGMLNSSLAIGNAENAVYANAMPIAQADAAATNQFALTNASAANQNSQFNAGQTNAVNTTNAQLQTDVSKSNAALQTDVNKQAAGDYNKALTTNAQTAADMAKQTAAVNADLVRNTNDQITNLQKQRDANVAQIQSATNMDTAAKNAAIAEADKSLAKALHAFDNLKSLNLPGLLDFGGMANLADTRSTAMDRQKFLASPNSINDPASTYYAGKSNYRWNTQTKAWEPYTPYDPYRSQRSRRYD